VVAFLEEVAMILKARTVTRETDKRERHVPMILVLDHASGAEWGVAGFAPPVSVLSDVVYDLVYYS
jgi:hypothetical protein